MTWPLSAELGLWASPRELLSSGCRPNQRSGFGLSKHGCLTASDPFSSDGSFLGEVGTARAPSQIKVKFISLSSPVLRT